MSRRDRLNVIARRQVDPIGQAPGMRYLADDYDIMDILAGAEFLAGDRVED